MIECLLFLQTLLEIYIESKNEIIPSLEKILNKLKKLLLNENKVNLKLNLAAIKLNPHKEERIIKTDRFEEF